MREDVGVERIDGAESRSRASSEAGPKPSNRRGAPHEGALIMPSCQQGSRYPSREVCEGRVAEAHRAPPKARVACLHPTRPADAVPRAAERDLPFIGEDHRGHGAVSKHQESICKLAGLGWLEQGATCAVSSSGAAKLFRGVLSDAPDAMLLAASGRLSANERT